MKISKCIKIANNYPYTIEFNNSPDDWVDIITWCCETYGEPHGRLVHGARWFGQRDMVHLRFRILADAEWFLLRWA